ncbi:beta-glucuronosyltransferase GlcAT14A-like isoform X2 [Zingiber officinale]|nr:beta-glucuronosyltransferase GlcAT14A-like [Zingiber officinale]XP_042453631.1 beta-glucuronosyltransferase GlcAT14A-like isoform X2 [Zingiber officinale]XP_042453632.1 beta-glucuronosyltransferase GlcAT14A-like isoform X2 [Zingiber officinale]XP_042453633.1 beta-glucuronosyltransferase GlcAT14A-like isoform X2 [Zingiber officinale]
MLDPGSSMWRFRLPRSIGIPVLVVAAITLVVLSHWFIGGGWAANQKLEVAVRPLLKGPSDPPVFAYWISGTGGDAQKILRLLKAVYHPRNHYLLHLDSGCDDLERKYVAHSIESERLFEAFRNVDIVGKSYPVDRTGPSAVAATLHGAAVLLRLDADWDWFITLSAVDYPLVTQDDLLHVFTSLPRNLNFIDHTSDLGWKEYERFDKIIVDPNLFMENNTQLLITSGDRKTPNSFKLFTGSPWVILSRPFVEHCVHGSDNLPRKLLMYFANVAYSTEAYFQTVICNSPEFRNTTVNNDLRYFVWDDPPGLEPLFLNKTHLKDMTRSRAAFARKFMEEDPVLKKVDKKMLRYKSRQRCFGKSGYRAVKNLEGDPCLSQVNVNIVRPSISAMRLRSLVTELISSDRLYSNQCKI